MVGGLRELRDPHDADDLGEVISVVLVPIHLMSDTVARLAATSRYQTSLVYGQKITDEVAVPPHERDFWHAWSLARTILDAHPARLLGTVVRLRRAGWTTVFREGAWHEGDFSLSVDRDTWDEVSRLPPTGSDTMSYVVDIVLNEYLDEEADKALAWVNYVSAPSRLRGAVVKLVVPGGVPDEDDKNLASRVASSLRREENRRGKAGLVRAVVKALVAPGGED